MIDKIEFISQNNFSLHALVMHEIDLTSIKIEMRYANLDLISYFNYLSFSLVRVALAYNRDSCSPCAYHLNEGSSKNSYLELELQILVRH